MKKELTVKNINISFFSQKEEDYISLTDIAKFKNSDDPRFAIQNWMRTHATVEFIGLWEVINNPNFNRLEFDTVKNKAGSMNWWSWGVLSQRLRPDLHAVKQKLTFKENPIYDQ